MALIDLEAYGVYQPPLQSLPLLAQSFGLMTLSQPFLSDFEIHCSDGVRLACSKKLLEDRWSWFSGRMEEFKKRAKGMLKAQQKRIDEKSNGLDSVDQDTTSPNTPSAINDLRLTPRTLSLPEPSPLVLAFLQYLYTLSLCTPHQFSLPVLTSLLIFSKTYDEQNLRALVVHALHEVLNGASWTAASVYEAATVGGCTALQIRALRVLM